MSTRRIQLGMLSLLVALLAVGCSSEPATDEHAAGSPDPHAQAAETHEAVAQADLEIILAKADAVDGATDKVISKCAGCALGMPGSAAHAVKVGEYEMHFCSDDCKSGFSEEPEKAVMALQIPEE